MSRRFMRFCCILSGLIVCLVSLASCTRIAFHPDLEQEMLRLAALDESQIPEYLRDLDREDTIGSFYRDDTTKEATLAFFTTLAHSTVVAKAILDNAERYGVPAALAFALAFEESRFEVNALHRNADSVDRGLFQLNSKSFPKLEIADFYNPDINAKNGVSHLQYCLRTAGNEVTALAMYNAGNGRVDRGATPRKTLDYVYRVLKYQENIASLFAAKVVAAQPRGLWKARLSLVPSQGQASQ